MKIVKAVAVLLALLATVHSAIIMSPSPPNFNLSNLPPILQKAVEMTAVPVCKAGVQDKLC
jgi:hypothetical protein